MKLLSTRRRRAAFVVLILSLLILVGYWYIRVPDPERRPVPPAVVNIRRIGKALAAYDHAYGTLPYDPKGPDYALYKLKPFVEDVKIFSAPPDGVDVIHRGRPKPRWDDVQGRILNCDYDYLNKPNLSLFDDKTSWHLIILAEKTGVREKGKNYLAIPGAAMWYSYEESMPKEILGKYEDAFARVHDSPEEAMEASRPHSGIAPK